MDISLTYTSFKPGPCLRFLPFVWVGPLPIPESLLRVNVCLDLDLLRGNVRDLYLFLNLGLFLDIDLFLDYVIFLNLDLFLDLCLFLILDIFVDMDLSHDLDLFLNFGLSSCSDLFLAFELSHDFNPFPRYGHLSRF